MSQKKILIIDDEENLRHMLTIILDKEGYLVEEAENGFDAEKKVEKNGYDIILCDIKMPKMDGLTFLQRITPSSNETTIIMMSAYGTIDTAVDALKLGAYDYISKPFKPDEIILTLKKAEERENLRRENLLLKGQAKREYSFENIVVKSKQMLDIFETIKKVAQFKSTVLISGESGTGKELVAKGIHYNSPRSDRPLIAINCGAIPENLLESELFGHVKGAFTSASKTKKGLFEEADGGTLLLDEVGELPLALQVKLLRVLQEDKIRRVGDTNSIDIDVRIIAATTRNLAEEVKKGNFRDDLFYRLNVVPIHIPPLRERKEVIPELVKHLMEKQNQRLNTKVEGLSAEALEALIQYEWKGNIRELENIIERAMILSETNSIELANIPPLITERSPSVEFLLPPDELSIKKASRMIEERLIRKALVKTRGNRTHAAKLLEVSHRALLYKIKEYKIEDGKNGN